MDNDFSSRLKLAMDRVGINQTQLGMRSGVTPSKVNRYVKGIYQPKQDALVAMAKVLGVTPEWLATGTENNKLNLSELSEIEKEAFSLFLKLSKDSQLKILDRMQIYFEDEQRGRMEETEKNSKKA